MATVHLQKHERAEIFKNTRVNFFHRCCSY